MCTDARFRSDLAKGKKGEKIFMNWCDKKGITYVDVRDIEEYRVQDVDFLTGKNRTKLDVKYNEGMLGCGALVIEDLSSVHEKNDGWWRKESNWFSFVAPLEESEGYIIITLFRGWIKAYMKKYKLGIINRREIQNGYGWYIKVNDKNMYNKDKESIVDFVRKNYSNSINIDKLVQYVDANGNLIKCKAEV